VWLMIAFFALAIAQWFVDDVGTRTVSYSQFKDAVAEKRFSNVVVSEDWVKGMLAEGEQAVGPDGKTPAKQPVMAWRSYRVPGDEGLLAALDESQVPYSFVPKSDFWLWVLPLALVLLLWSFMVRRMTAVGQGSQGLLAFGKSKPRAHLEPNTGVTFSDVAGIDEAVEELQEIVSFLRTPEKYQRLGGKIPKGVLLMGPPGTGKTLLARAVAGDAGVPFFSLSGAEFMEMFVGVGAARVRDLFEQAQAKAPAIIFIDELDALAKSRNSSSVVGGHDEREQTLNQLLSEMDGFDPRVGLIVLAATNRPDVLDQALLRPGRFDRQVLVDRPDKRGRLAILQIHSRRVKLAPDIDLDAVSSHTPGFAGADLANVVNEAALLAARRNADAVYMPDFDAAIERVVAGLRRKNRRMNEGEKRIVAYHEAGHAVVGHFLKYADPVQKVSIIPHGLGALGYTMQMPLEDRYLMRVEELRDKMAGLLGGRAAEEIFLASVSTGASDDLRKVTEIARVMITEHGMSESIGAVSLRRGSRSRFLSDEMSATFGDKGYSERTAEIIDDEVKRLIDEALMRAREVIAQHRAEVERLARRLLENEVVDRDELERLLGPAVEHDTDTPPSWNGSHGAPPPDAH
jgi:cell division protease FtsH